MCGRSVEAYFFPACGSRILRLNTSRFSRSSRMILEPGPGPEPVVVIVNDSRQALRTEFLTAAFDTGLCSALFGNEIGSRLRVTVTGPGPVTRGPTRRLARNPKRNPRKVVPLPGFFHSSGRSTRSRPSSRGNRPRRRRWGPLRNSVRDSEEPPRH